MNKVVSALSDAYANGAAKLAAFAPSDVGAFDDAARTDLQGLSHLLGYFLLAPGVRGALPEIEIPDFGSELPPHRAMGAFEFEGALVQLLLLGGAYGGSVASEDVARRLARDFVDAIAGERRLQIVVFAIHGAWTSWFYDVAWDGTFVVYDSAWRRWTCLFLTDTD